MGKIGPEGLPRRERGFPNAPLFPVGYDTICKTLPTITPDTILDLTQQRRSLVKKRDIALIDFLNIVYRDYQERERGVCSSAYLDFYAGAMFVDGFLEAQSPKQIPILVRNQEKNDVIELLHFERATQEEFATSRHIPPSSIERIAYERIREFARKEENESNQELLFGQVILNIAAKYPGDDGAFLVGAAVYLYTMEAMWNARKAQAFHDGLEQQRKDDMVVKNWSSEEQREIDDIFEAIEAEPDKPDIGTILGAELARETEIFLRKRGQQDAA